MKTAAQLILLALLIAAGVAGCSALAQAGHCRVQRQVVVKHAYVQPVILNQVAPYYVYSVGAALQEEALLKRLEQRLAEKHAVKEPQHPVLHANCAKCHSPGTKAVLEQEAPLFFDAEGKLTATDAQKRKMKAASESGSMPPTAPLSDDDYLRVVQELGVVDEPAPVVAPKPGLFERLKTAVEGE